MNTPNQLQTAEPRVKLALKKCRQAFVSVGLYSFFINLLMLTGPLFMLQIYDRVLASKSTSTLTALLILVITLFIFLGLLEYTRGRILARIGELFEAELSASAFQAMLDHSLNQKTHIGTEPLRNLQEIRQFIASPGPATLFDLPWTPVYLAVNYALHPWLGIYSMASALFLIILTLINETLSRPALEAYMIKSRASQITAEETRQSAASIKAMGMRDQLFTHWQEIQGTANKASTSLSSYAGFFHALSKAARLALQSGSLALGAWLVIEGNLTAGAMIAASIILTRAMAPIDQSINQWRQFLAARSASKSLTHTLETYRTDEDLMPLPTPKGQVSIEGLVVTAPGERKPLLSGIEFELQPGRALAILGPTGAGKTTLALTLAGIWPPLSGTVRLDGAAIDQWRADEFGRAIGYLPQSVELISGTISQNISRFEVEPDPAAVIHAAKQANVHELILTLKDGYDTLIGNGGEKLSGGQTQRIGLARALYNQPRLIILDEPNANLDAEGEAALERAIIRAKANSQTVIIIAHRPNALKACDLVLFLKDGHQAAFGQRDEILPKILKTPPIEQPDTNQKHHRQPALT